MAYARSPEEGAKRFRKRAYKGRSALYKTLSNVCGFTDKHILKMLGVRNRGKERTEKILDKVFTYEKDYLTLNIVEILSQAMYSKGIFRSIDDATSYIMYATKMNRNKLTHGFSENDMIVSFAVGKMLDRKLRVYTTALDCETKQTKRPDFTHVPEEIIKEIESDTFS